jgi:hypothetical protein
MLFGAVLSPGQYPPMTGGNTNGGPTRTRLDHQLPNDQAQPEKPSPLRRKIDTQQIKRDADELAKLTEEVPPDVERAGKGVLSKDLNERLKRIEKLAKQLRRELNP